MSTNVLSLPIDIPWKRLCVSEDMIDPKVCDRKFPYRWRSSVAVFSYEPPEDQQTYDGMIVSYLKVACTITSFQPNPEEVGLKDRRVDSYWNTPLLIEDYVNKVSKAYPCYGAILEVGVAPSEKTIDGEEIPLNKYPYFMDFEPKKRELYELVSETGEKMSRSLDDVNVRKGLTTTNSREVLDETTIGLKVGAEGKLFGIGASAEGSIANKSGTKDINTQEVQDIRTTDNAREQRENFSHTTQLTQMYQQLNSYHLGTNRAVFFLLPRPHIIEDTKDTPLTFINGPRKLEGIQEFFLVVMRPKEIKDICVEAYLETAHVGQVPTYGNSFNKDTDITPTLSLSVQSDEDAKTIKTKSGSITYSVRPGWEIDTSKNGGYTINIIKEAGLDFCAVTEIDQKHLVLKGKIKTGLKTDRDTGKPPESGGPVGKPGKDTIDGDDGALEANATVYLRQGSREQTGTASGLYITGRGVCCCQTPNDHNKRLLTESVVWEQVMPLALDKSVGDLARMRVVDANRVRAEIDRMMVQSMNHPDRYEAGTVSFAETQLVAQSVANLISTEGHPDDHPVAMIEGLNSRILDKIASRAPNASRSDLLFMTPAEQRDRFNLSPNEVRQLRRAIVGLEGQLPEPQNRWDPPSKRRTEQTVANVIGLSLAEAEETLTTLKFSVGEVAYEDSTLPTNTVLTQDPEAETTALSGTNVNLILATGSSVRIPDLVGKPLSQAVVMLRDAGLKSEPEIRFISSEEYPRNQVLEVSPGMRSHITPNSNVTLQVASRSNEYGETTLR
jgi:PASTA domain